MGGSLAHCHYKEDVVNIETGNGTSANRTKCLFLNSHIYQLNYYDVFEISISGRC